MKTRIINAKKFYSYSELKKITGGGDIAGRCKNGNSCTIFVSGHGEQPGGCETNSNNQCVCKALDFPASAVSSECLN